MHRSHLLFVCALLFGLSSLALPSQQSQAQSTQRIFLALIGVSPVIDPAAEADLAIRREALRLINIERLKVGCPAASENPWLMARAQEWSNYMRDYEYFYHSDISPTLYIDDQHVFGSIGENISNAAPTAAAAVTYGWMLSPGHRDTMISCKADDPLTGVKASDYRYEFGIGMARRPVGANAYWTLVITSIYTPPQH